MFAVLASAYVANSTHDAPMGGFVYYDGQQVAVKPANVPTWRHEYAAAFPGCHKALPARQVPAQVLEVQENATVVRVDFTDAWARTHDNNTANNGWIVGACR